jgi:hypothetical protein
VFPIRSAIGNSKYKSCTFTHSHALNIYEKVLGRWKEPSWDSDKFTLSEPPTPNTEEQFLVWRVSVCAPCKRPNGWTIWFIFKRFSIISGHERVTSKNRAPSHGTRKWQLSQRPLQNLLFGSCDTLYQLKLALTSPAGCGRSVGTVRLQTKTTEFSF